MPHKLKKFENKKLIIPMTLLYFIAEMHQWKRNFEPTLANTEIVNDFWLIYYSSPWVPAQIDIILNAQAFCTELIHFIHTN